MVISYMRFLPIHATSYTVRRHAAIRAVGTPSIHKHLRCHKLKYFHMNLCLNTVWITTYMTLVFFLIN